jgi:hypothetical protein
VPCVPACAVWVRLVEESTAEKVTLLIWSWVCNESEATNTTTVVIASSSVDLVPVRALTVVAGEKLNAVGILMLSACEEKGPRIMSDLPECSARSRIDCM